MGKAPCVPSLQRYSARTDSRSASTPHLIWLISGKGSKLNGKDIPEADVVRIATDLRDQMESMAAEDSEKQLTFFEFTTGIAFKYFSEQKADIVVR